MIKPTNWGLFGVALLWAVVLALYTSGCTENNTYAAGPYAQTCSPPDNVRSWSGGTSDFITKEWYCFGAREEWVAITYSKRPWCDDWRLEAVDVREGRCKQ